MIIHGQPTFGKFNIFVNSRRSIVRNATTTTATYGNMWNHVRSNIFVQIALRLAAWDVRGHVEVALCDGGQGYSRIRSPQVRLSPGPMLRDGFFGTFTDRTQWSVIAIECST